MKFSRFTQQLNDLEERASRNEMVEILAKLFEELKLEQSSDQVSQAIYLMLGRVVPAYVSLEFNFSTKLLLRALANNDVSEDAVNLLYAELGDVGEVASKIFTDNKSQELSIADVHKELKEIAIIEGKDSQKIKTNKLQQLFSKTGPVEAKFIARIIVGKTRLGLSDKTILDAISWAQVGDKSNRKVLDRAFGVESDLGKIAEVALVDQDQNRLENMQIRLGVPIASKLVEREKDTQTIMERLQECYIQPKYDGLRMQIHYNSEGFVDETAEIEKDNMQLLDSPEVLPKVKIFSRNMEDLTNMFPDVITEVEKIDHKSFVLDCETIGYNPKTGQLIDFQETMTRKRKSGIAEKAKEIPVKVFCFDLLYIDGDDIMDEAIETRLTKMEELMSNNKSDDIVMSETPLVKTAEAMQLKFEEYINEGLEGLIAKGKGTPYEPGTRNYDWIKLKAASQSELADTVDAVVLGYYRGTGVRAKFGIGALLLGIYHEADDKFYSLAKLGTGMTDQQFKEIKLRLDELKIDEYPANVEIVKEIMPDVLVTPEVVVEVEADEITRSKVHGRPGEDGLSLRFPRLKQFDRDKEPEQATTAAELEKIYQLSRI